MRSLRLVAAVLVLALAGAACGGEENDEEASDYPVTTTSESSAPTTSQPRMSTPTTAALRTTTTTVVEVAATTTTTEPPGATAVLRPPPTNVACRAGTAANELLLTFDAFPNPADILRIDVYVGTDGPRGRMNLNGQYPVSQIDTSGDRWSVPARKLPTNVPLWLAATSFNQLGQESGWYIVEGRYTGQGAPCGDASGFGLPPTTCTAGCDDEGEAGEPTP